ncbi:MAG: phosphatidylserine decarboxylase family protein [Alistipes sp.]|jgi:phosphatidylserine decarboxylase|nr:phosphatidylserine decarboxylase family protein [Alistipes sp.]
MKISKEGFKIITVSGVLCLALWLLMYYMLSAKEDMLWLLITLAVFLLVFWFFIVSFFRAPRRVRIHDSDLVFSPCDGRVVVTEIVRDEEYFDGEERMQVSIFMDITNVHINWFPVGGVVKYFKYHPGRFLVAWHPKSSTENERTTTVVETPDGKEVLFRQIAGLVARRVVSYIKVGETVEQNSTCGFIKFGSRIDLLLPKDAKLLVEIGDKVVGTQTPIARIAGESIGEDVEMLIE